LDCTDNLSIGLGMLFLPTTRVLRFWSRDTECNIITLPLDFN
jgi:hypothetical protein